MAITGVADFESNPDSINHDCVNFTQALHSNSSSTNKIRIHQILFFGLILVDTDGKLIFEKLIVVKMLVLTFSKLKTK